MMIKKYIYGLAAAAALTLGLSGCATDSVWTDSPDTEGSGWNDDGTMRLTVSIDMPDMSAASRALGNEVPEDLPLWVLVFETESGNLRQAIRATPSNRTPETCDKTGKPVHFFDVSLNPTEGNATIHFIMTDQPDIADQIGSTGSAGGIGNESQLRTLKTNDGHQAYWSRVELGMPILSSQDQDPAAAKANREAITAKLYHVLMVRNFGKVSVHVNEDVNFQVNKMYLYNWSEQGSVCPYLIIDGSEETSGNNGFVIFFERDADLNITARKYDEILATGHTGNPPAGTVIRRDEPIVSSERTNNDGTKEQELFFYERPYRGEDRSFVILEGRRTVAGNPTGDAMFYKIDLGKKDPNSNYGEFKYYNLYRNFDYRIIIDGVAADGYGSREEAVNGIVFNNISASVETRNLTSISEGDQTIIVNKTSYVFTTGNKDDGWVLRGQYINGSKVDSNELEIEIHGDFINVEPRGGLNDGWKEWDVTIKEGEKATAAPRQATIIVYRGRIGGTDENPEFGLYRTITITFIDHFEIERMDTYPGLWEDFDEVPWDWGEKMREVGQGVDAPLTLFFQLPQGLPEAIFPLEFTIESNRQNIQNAYQGNAAVKTVPASKSLFWDSGKVETARIQFQKTVTWQEYSAVETGNYIVRARFLTTTDLAQDGIGVDGTTGSSSETTVRVYNPYFGTKEDGFTRDTRTSDPTIVYADFSSSTWEGIISTLAATNHNRYTATNNLTDNIVLIEGLTTGNVRSMGSGTDADGTYISTSNANDMFQYSTTYSGDVAERTIRVEVMSDKQPLVTCTGLTFTLKETKEGNTYCFEASIPTTATATTRVVQIKPAAAASQKFYKINIYPRWDEMQ